MRLIYTTFYYLAIPFILVRLLWRSRHSAGYRKRWSERFGFIKPVLSAKNIWVHAVSVGETIAAIPLIKALLQQYSDYTITVTTTTPTGSELVIKHFGKQVNHVYSPFDTPTSVMRFLNRTRPSLSIIMETELWPNIYYFCKKREIPIILANGRLSERSSLRYQVVKKVTSEILSACHILMAQSVLDGERYLRLGLDPKKLVISGNIKFDMHIPESTLSKGREIKASLRERVVLIAASTHEGEEDIILTAFEKIREKVPQLFLMLVPRHVNRFEKVADLCRSRGWKTILRSDKKSISDETDILLVDTIGELRMIYAAGDIAFVGGSLVPIGGHNLIEPAALGLPILTGPNLQNFVEIGNLLKNAGAVQIVDDANSVADAVIALCDSKELRDKMGECALQTIEANKGALGKHIFYIDQVLKKS